jgi:hypothetical protein
MVYGIWDQSDDVLDDDRCLAALAHRLTALLRASPMRQTTTFQASTCAAAVVPSTREVSDGCTVVDQVLTQQFGRVASYWLLYCMPAKVRSRASEDLPATSHEVAARIFQAAAVSMPC